MSDHLKMLRRRKKKRANTTHGDSCGVCSGDNLGKSWEKREAASEISAQLNTECCQRIEWDGRHAAGCPTIESEGDDDE